MNTQDQIDQIIVELQANEFSVEKIAKEFGVTTSYVWQINNGTYGTIRGYNYPVRRILDKPKEKPSDMEVWYDDCYEVKL